MSKKWNAFTTHPYEKPVYYGSFDTKEEAEAILDQVFSHKTRWVQFAEPPKDGRYYDPERETTVSIAPATKWDFAQPEEHDGYSPE